MNISYEEDYEIATGVPCASCGHALKPTKIYHLIGPWLSPKKFESAMAGELNMATCEYCQQIGQITTPFMLYIPDRNRAIISYSKNFIAPQRERLRQLLLRLLKKRLTSNMIPAIQTVSDRSEIPQVLEIPDILVEFDNLMLEGQKKRLWVKPQQKAAELIRQLFACENLLSFTPAASSGITISFAFTQFERTPLGMHLLKVELDKISPKSDYQNQIVKYLCEIVGQVDLSQGSMPLSEQTKKMIDELPTYNELVQKSEEQPQKKNRYVMLSQGLCDSEIPEIAIDACEAYFSSIVDPQKVEFEDVQCAVTFGSALHQAQNEHPTEAPISYLNFALNHLPVASSGQIDPSVAFLSGYARELAGRELMRLGVLPEALNRFLEAVPLYKLADRKDGFEKVISAALPIAQTLGDNGAYSKLETWLNEIEEIPMNDPVLGLHHEIKNIAQTHSIRKVLYVHTDWSNARLSKKELQSASHKISITIIPINYKMVEGEPPPPDAITDIKVETPYHPHKWSMQTKLSTEFNCQFFVAQLIKVEKSNLVIHDEQILLHPLLEWINQGNDDDDILLRNKNKRSIIWDWARQEGHYYWLLGETEWLQKTFGPPTEWPPVLVVGLGRALSQAALSEETPDIYRKSLGQNGGSLLHLVLERIKTAPHISPQLTHQALFEIRSLFGRLNEYFNNLESAKDLFLTNVTEGFKLRHFSHSPSHREAIQRLIGADANRLNRIRIQMSVTFPPPKNEVIKIFDTAEITRSRILLDSLPHYLRISEPIETERLSDYGSKDTLEFSSKARELDGYIQLSLIRSQGSFTGFWLAAYGKHNGHPCLKRIKYDEPYDISVETWDFFGSLQGSLEQQSEKKRVSAYKCIEKFASWVGKEVLPKKSKHKSSQKAVWISPSSYLLTLPWSFAGLIQPKITNKPIVPIISVFSGASANYLESHSFHSSENIAIYLDPLGDLPEVRSIENNLKGHWHLSKIDIRTKLQASATSFLRDVRDTDLLIYVGHGQKLAEQSGLIFSLGREVWPKDIEIGENSSSTLRKVRVAVVLSCWGGVIDWMASDHSWEADGIVYRLKSSGFDFIITSLWPISPTVASLFLNAFSASLSEGTNVPSAFVEAYQSVLDKIGYNRLCIEGGCIQLVG